MIGTSLGKIYSFKTNDGSSEAQPYQAVGAETPITQLVTLNNIDDNEAFLMLSDGKEVLIYVHNKKDVREVDFGEDGQMYMHEQICKV